MTALFTHALVAVICIIATKAFSLAKVRKVEEELRQLKVSINDVKSTVSTDLVGAFNKLKALKL